MVIYSITQGLTQDLFRQMKTNPPESMCLLQAILGDAKHKFSYPLPFNGTLKLLLHSI